MIERLYVHNFRCLENFTLDLTGRPSALLIGRNGAGKSTLLQCLKLFQSICRGSGRVGSLISASDFTQHRTDQPMRFELEITLAGKRFKYAVSLNGHPSSERRVSWMKACGLTEMSSSADTFRRFSSQGREPFGLDWHIFALPVINELPGESAIQDVKAFFATMVLVALFRRT